MGLGPDGRVLRDDSATLRQRSERALLAEFPVTNDDDDDDDYSEEEEAAVEKRPPPPAKLGAKRTRATARRSPPERIARGREKTRVDSPEPVPGDAGTAERVGDPATPSGVNAVEGDGSRRESPAEDATNAARRDREVARFASIRGRVFSGSGDATIRVNDDDDAPEGPASPTRRGPKPDSVSRGTSSKRRRVAMTARTLGGFESTGMFSRVLAAVTPSALKARGDDRCSRQSNAALPSEGTTTSIIPREDRLPPLRPKARMGGPRGRQLWRKVREHKNLLIGRNSGEASAGASSYWRRHAGVAAFLFSVDLDVHGRKRNRGEALRKAATKLSRRTRFPEDEVFKKELASLKDLTRAETHLLCKERGLRVRDGADRSVIDADVLKARLLHYAHARFGNDWFEPSPFGRNKRGYYAPLITAFAQCVLVSSVTVGTTYAAYAFAEQWHAAQNCHKIWNWMNPQCQAADFMRTHAKQAVYRWYYQVGSVIALRAGAWFDAISKEAGRLAAEATDSLASKMDVEGKNGDATVSRRGERARR